MKAESKFLILIIISFILISIVSPSPVAGEEITSKYFPYIQEMCAVHDFPFEIAVAVAIVESNVEMVVSDKNWNNSYDIGIYQLNSKYVKYFEETFWYEDRSFDPYNPYDNIEMAIILLTHLYVTTGYYDLAIRSFHQGLHGLKHNPDASNSYLIKVINVLNTLEIK